jgi:hypothetical protein
VPSVVSVWRGTQNVLAVAPATLAPPSEGERLFAARVGIKLGERLPPGDYVLQVSATAADPGGRTNERLSAQRIAFEVR